MAESTHDAATDAPDVAVRPTMNRTTLKSVGAVLAGIVEVPGYVRSGRETNTKGARMLREFATVNHWADDLEVAKQWYTDLLGLPPYFERPGYAEFRIGDYRHELGLIDSRYSPDGHGAGPAGAVLH
jgi:hypothetical protein